MSSTAHPLGLKRRTCVLLLSLLASPSVLIAQEGRVPGGNSRVSLIAIQATAQVQGEAPSPEYPTGLRVARVSGEVVLRFLVETTGEVACDSILVVSATHFLFADAARRALLRRKYRPALQDGRPVRQWIQERFVFHPPD